MNVQLQNIVFFPARGGIETYLYYASKNLLKLGHEPTILCSRHLPNLPREDAYENIRVLRHPSFSLPFPASLLHPFYHVGKLQGVIKKYSGDVDVVWSRHPCYCYSSCKALQVPVIFIHATVWPLEAELLVKGKESMRARTKLRVKLWEGIASPQASFIEERAMWACDKIVVFSKINKRHVTDYYNISDAKVKVIPPGVDLERYKRREKDEELLKELGVPRRARIVLTVTRLVPRKNIDMLIEVLARMSERDVYLVIVGDGPQRPFLEKLTRQLGLTNQIRFVGYRKDVERFHSIADVFALPSMYEPFGHVFLEAMASGVPSIGLKTDYPEVITACDEIIDDGKTGYTLKPSINDLEEKIEKIIWNAELKEKMSKKARETCERRYSWEKHVKNVLSLTNSY